MITDRKRILIVGGVAGGSSCATRARRFSETAEIILFERGSFISSANCDLPYYAGDMITDEKKMLVANETCFGSDLTLVCDWRMKWLRSISMRLKLPSRIARRTRCIRSPMMHWYCSRRGSDSSTLARN